MHKSPDPQERLWYARRAAENGWSRNVLVLQIGSGLYHRQGKAINNFQKTLPPPQSDLARQILKDPYNFDFLTLVAHLQKFLLELGVGFSFVGSQYRLEVAGQEYRLDLLLYHLRLRCFIVIDLKAGSFLPEYALRNTATPMGVAEFKYLEKLPENLIGSLPTIEELEAELGRGDD